MIDFLLHVRSERVGYETVIIPKWIFTKKKWKIGIKLSYKKLHVNPWFMKSRLHHNYLNNLSKEGKNEIIPLPFNKQCVIRN